MENQIEEKMWIFVHEFNKAPNQIILHPTTLREFVLYMQRKVQNFTGLEQGNGLFKYRGAKIIESLNIPEGFVKVGFTI